MSVQRKRVYVWEFPVRLTHWINVLSILTLSATGLYIGVPYMHAHRPDQYIMGTMRVIHFIAAYAFLFSVLTRVYWGFMGNKYAGWAASFPVSEKRRESFVNAIKYYLFISRRPPYSVGHMALAGFAYFWLYILVFGFMIVSGFAMYSLSHPEGAVWTILGGWLLGVMHVQTIRLFHHMGMYVILAFAILHVYNAWMLDLAEKNGIMGSIFGGYKFISGKEWE
jgi:Ni/Fe-hydrogenase 1 B-type cytochrome subunit